jgi:GH24 family phage-related lysozyme (muramidase)
VALRQRIQDNPELVAAALTGGDLNWTERRRLKVVQKRIQDEQQRTVADFTKKISQLTKAGNTLTEGGPMSASIPAQMRDGTPANIGALAAHYYKQSPKAALTMLGEGLTLTAKPDNNGALAIGFGYNFAGRSPEQAQKDLRASGVATADIAAVMAGKRAITVDQSIKLFEISSKAYEKTAKDAFGDGYDKLPGHIKAVLFDMAYNAGSPSKFTTVLNLFKAGKYDEASKNLTLKFKTKDGKWKNNDRRVRLWREMLSGNFEQYLAQYTKRKGK